MQIWPFVKDMGKHGAPTQPTHLFISPGFPDNDRAPEFGLNMCVWEEQTTLKPLFPIISVKLKSGCFLVKSCSYADVENLRPE